MEDTSGLTEHKPASMLRLYSGVISGSGTAASVTARAVGMCVVWMIMFLMTFLTTLPALFHILFIIAACAALVLFAGMGATASFWFSKRAAMEAPTSGEGRSADPSGFMPVKLSLYRDGHLLSERIASSEDDLYCPIEMDTGTGWLDAAGMYQEFLAKGCSQLTDTFRVCHSYEKWGDMQQETVDIEVRLQRLM